MQRVYYEESYFTGVILFNVAYAVSDILLQLKTAILYLLSRTQHV